VKKGVDLLRKETGVGSEGNTSLSMNKARKETTPDAGTAGGGERLRSITSEVKSKEKEKLTSLLKTRGHVLDNELKRKEEDINGRRLPSGVSVLRETDE